MKTLRYARYCGPAAVSKIAGINREVAGHLLKVMAKRRYGDSKRVRAGTSTCVMIDVFRFLGYKNSRWVTNMNHGSLDKEIQLTRGNTEIKIFSASNHYVSVCNGRVLEDNGVLPLNGQVRGYILVEKE